MKKQRTTQQPYRDWALDAAAKNPAFNEAVFSQKGNDYNYLMAYLAGENPGLNGHLSDIGKMSNHPTFSKESVYAIGDNKQAGQWVAPLGIDAGVRDASQFQHRASDKNNWLFNNPGAGLLMAPESQAYNKNSINPILKALRGY